MLHVWWDVYVVTCGSCMNGEMHVWWAPVCMMLMSIVV